ncbi:PE family protein [Mycobacterium malmoense]|uniref:PE domain-containing protein n=1 Tax=Mycobacterium malmoense TaxID=1780 RepID=A0ABX3SQ72_MYCMA|nr:PE family protein [Mycobacterium malmoense]OIN81545.1 hypothetical protein BMG05_06910 [Mycobacterium malmoense]ORA81201.1 hypothetical protein BST29_14840 [Mycobacterium malmoense]QZA15873.1 PE family protein [Mycobacterium malmoense]UNB92688.1 PE family protein [Mycobacterium malmoense]
MSFVSTVPEVVTDAAVNLAGVGSTLEQATVAAAGPTTTLTAAAADEVSTAISQLFGAYGQQFQTLSAQAAAFHNEFVSLLSGGAAAYLSTEVANAEQSLLNAVIAPAATGTTVAASSAAIPILGGLDPILGGLNAFLTGGNLAPYIGLPPILSGLDPILGDVSSLLFTGGPIGSILATSPLGPILNGVGQDVGGVVSTLLSGGLPALLSNPFAPITQALSGVITDVPGLQGLEPLLQPLLPGLSEAGQTASGFGDPYQVLFANTSANLQSLFATWSADPFPVLREVIANQQVYAQTIAAALAAGIQNLPAELANLPAEIQAGIQGLATFNPGALLQTYINQQIGYAQTISTSLQLAATDLGNRLPVFQADLAMASQAFAAGNYTGAVNDVAEGLLNLFIAGFNTSNLSNILLVGPAGDLLPILGIPGQMAQNFTNLLLAGSIPAQMAQNYTNLVDKLTNAMISTTISLQLASSPPIVMDAYFGLPLSLAFSALGSPFAGLNALATSAATFGTAVQSGNGVAALGALIDAPAVYANGVLNGETLVDLNMPVTVAGVTIPITMHLPFDGILVPPHPITATVDLSLLGIPLPVNLTLGGTPFQGLLPELINYLPEQLATVITPAA